MLHRSAVLKLSFSAFGTDYFKRFLQKGCQVGWALRFHYPVSEPGSKSNMATPQTRTGKALWGYLPWTAWTYIASSLFPT